jgi:Rrf2 family iron-sulfur cluster assembly transcriptional regulator
MVDMATQNSHEPVTLASISERQNISLSYLEQLFGKLRRHGIVESVRGPGGGYYLARNGTQISIADIISAVDEPMDATNCGGLGNCHEGKPCSTHSLWSGLNEVLIDYLTAVKLQQLVDDQRLQHNPDAAIPVSITKRPLRPIMATA